MPLSHDCALGPNCVIPQTWVRCPQIRTFGPWIPRLQTHNEPPKMKGTGFSPYIKPPKMKGAGFSPYIDPPRMQRASGPEGEKALAHPDVAS